MTDNHFFYEYVDIASSRWNFVVEIWGRQISEAYHLVEMIPFCLKLLNYVLFMFT